MCPHCQMHSVLIGIVLGVLSDALPQPSQSGFPLSNLDGVLVDEDVSEDVNDDVKADVNGHEEVPTNMDVDESDDETEDEELIPGVGVRRLLGQTRSARVAGFPDVQLPKKRRIEK